MNFLCIQLATEIFCPLAELVSRRSNGGENIAFTLNSAKWQLGDQPTDRQKFVRRDKNELETRANRDYGLGRERGRVRAGDRSILR